MAGVAEVGLGHLRSLSWVLLAELGQRLRQLSCGWGRLR